MFKKKYIMAHNDIMTERSLTALWKKIVDTFAQKSRVTALIDSRAYIKPKAGIPESDLAQSVQQSLEKATEYVIEARPDGICGQTLSAISLAYNRGKRLVLKDITDTNVTYYGTLAKVEFPGDISRCVFSFISVRDAETLAICTYKVYKGDTAKAKYDLFIAGNTQG